MKIETALIIMLSINLFLFFGQIASEQINQEYQFNPESPQFFNYENSTIGEYNSGDWVINDQLVKDELPKSQGGSILGGVGDWFTDVFQSIKNWFLGVTGVKYLVGIVNAVPNFLSSLPLPAIAKPFIFGISALWHAITLFLIVAFIRGN